MQAVAADMPPLLIPPIKQPIYFSMGGVECLIQGASRVKMIAMKDGTRGGRGIHIDAKISPSDFDRDAIPTIRFLLSHRKATKSKLLVWKQSFAYGTVTNINSVGSLVPWDELAKKAGFA